MKTCLVLGAAGFVGSELVRQLLVSTEYAIVGIDGAKAIEQAALPEYSAAEYSAVGGRLTLLAAPSDEALAELFAAHDCDVVIHCAESGPAQTDREQIWRTLQLLEAAAEYWRELPAWKQSVFRLLQVSAAGNAGAVISQLVRSYAPAHGLPALAATVTTAYGPRQSPDALVPQVVHDALTGRKILVAQQGEQVSAWLHVSDVCRGLLCVLAEGEPGQEYFLSGELERSEMEVVTSVCRALDELELGLRQRPTSQLIRYAPAQSTVTQLAPSVHSTPVWELGWRPAVDFEAGIRHTVRWYLDRPHWRAEYAASHQPQAATAVARSERSFLRDHQSAEIQGVVFEPLDREIDGRGWQTSLLTDSSSLTDNAAWRLSACESRPGVTRGPVEHRDHPSYLGFTGPGEFRLYLWDCRSNSATSGVRHSTLVGESNPMSVTIPAGVVHAYRNIGSQSGLVFTMDQRSSTSRASELRTTSSVL